MLPGVLPIFQGQFHLERVNILLQLSNKRSGASNVGHKDFHGISDLVGWNKHFVDLSFNFDFLQASWRMMEFMHEVSVLDMKLSTWSMFLVSR